MWVIVWDTRPLTFTMRVAHIDQQIGQIIHSTKEAGIYDKTTFIISADHGGIGFGPMGEKLRMKLRYRL